VLPLHIVGTNNRSTSHNKVLPHTTTIEINAYVSIAAASYLFKLRNRKKHKVDLLWLADGGRGDVVVVPVEGGSHTFDLARQRTSPCIMQ
jgi:hypothetical protein